MTQITHINQVVQVKKVRSFGYATVDLISPDGSIRKRDKTFVVKFPEVANDAVRVGSLWKITGQEKLSHYVINDFAVSEYCLDAGEISYLKPSGRILSRWISSNISGIGKTIADRLTRLEGLKEAVENNDRAKLLSVSGMTNSRVDRLIEGWPDEHLYEVMSWLESQNLPLGLGPKLIDIFGDNALENVKAHPFLLMTMGASFEKTMEVAESLGLEITKNEVISGVALHFAVRHSFRTGSTVLSKQELIEGSSKIIGQTAPSNIGEVAVSEGLLAKVEFGYQVYGAAVQEVAVATFLADCLARSPGDDALLSAWERHLTEEKALKALSRHEKGLRFALTAEQRNAVIGAVMSPVCGISGGAGTGKTTILKAIIAVFSDVADSLPVYQVALSGRAAQRMSESTGLPAQSIAKLIADHVGQGRKELPTHLLLIIDEASMVDLLSMYRLIGILPGATRIIFVGDTEQLPPIGAGLIFHSLTDTQIPFFNLSEVKRQADDSAVHKFAMSIRTSNLQRPEPLQGRLSSSADCALEENASIGRLVEVWEESGGIDKAIVLSPVRKGFLGVDNINQKLQSHIGEDRLPLSYVDEVRGWIPWVSQRGEMLLEGDPVLITKNNYDEDADLRNGDLGVISEVYFEPDEGGCLGELIINGEKVGVSPDLLEKISLGYAVTVHKSQGSQWHTCIVALLKEGIALTDKALIYTAATRATDRLVMMGDFNLVEKAVAKGSIALRRKTNLKGRLAQAFSSSKLGGTQADVSF
ncbi:MAG: ATP-dependent RecD-like DNA helicase [Candidatus Thiodiazotropha taylori]|nr:ATP-dependent RecD-like DNA helicase [Candidatus Thiodiazotropha taylori]MCG8113286.1 ATP-dependent RecD-like DNA helicase [Candidatus Thiodiazotropha taylori]MCW4285647.1 ATP-dependent RecD-like DNA helicase [Candidatus Thiodiazotropha taylori]MCW4327736.1 ATP-dependent RecD-like DNA helicase [Candidatus Thiodiazotropha taylori]